MYIRFPYSNMDFTNLNLLAEDDSLLAISPLHLGEVALVPAYILNIEPVLKQQLNSLLRKGVEDQEGNTRDKNRAKVELLLCMLIQSLFIERQEKVMVLSVILLPQDSEQADGDASHINSGREGHSSSCSLQQRFFEGNDALKQLSSDVHMMNGAKRDILNDDDEKTGKDVEDCGDIDNGRNVMRVLVLVPNEYDASLMYALNSAGNAGNANSGTGIVSIADAIPLPSSTQLASLLHTWNSTLLHPKEESRRSIAKGKTSRILEELFDSSSENGDDFHSSHGSSPVDNAEEGKEVVDSMSTVDSEGAMKILFVGAIDREPVSMASAASIAHRNTNPTAGNMLSCTVKDGMYDNRDMVISSEDDTEDVRDVVWEGYHQSNIDNTSAGSVQTFGTAMSHQSTGSDSNSLHSAHDVADTSDILDAMHSMSLHDETSPECDEGTTIHATFSHQKQDTEDVLVVEPTIADSGDGDVSNQHRIAHGNSSSNFNYAAAVPSSGAELVRKTSFQTLLPSICEGKEAAEETAGTNGDNKTVTPVGIGLGRLEAKDPAIGEVGVDEKDKKNSNKDKQRAASYLHSKTLLIPHPAVHSLFTLLLDLGQENLLEQTSVRGNGAHLGPVVSQKSGGVRICGLSLLSVEAAYKELDIKVNEALTNLETYLLEDWHVYHW
jgi:hypothetical protein